MKNFLDNMIIKSDMENIYDSMKDENISRVRNASFYVTGASGMVGSYFVYYLIYLNEIRGHEISIYACARDIEKLRAKFGIYTDKKYFKPVIYDVVDEVPIADHVDYVIHAASPAVPSLYTRIPVETILPNTVGLNHLLDYARKTEAKSFVFISSSNVYGTLNAPEVEDKSGVLNYIDVKNSYAESKRCGEALCRAYHSEYGTPAKVIRIYHTYGPTMDLVNDTRSFTAFVNNIVRNEDVVLMSRGLARKGFCYLSDTISAMFAVLLDGEDGEIYNVGNMNEFVSIRELAEMLVNLYPERGLRVIFRVSNEQGKKPGPDVIEYPADMKKVEALGYSPSVSTREGFKRVIDYFTDMNGGAI